MRNTRGHDVTLDILMPAIILHNLDRGEYFFKPGTTELTDFWAQRAVLYDMGNNI